MQRMPTVNSSITETIIDNMVTATILLDESLVIRYANPAAEQLFSQSQKHYRQMGKLVAEGKKLPIKTLYAQYQSLLMEALRLKATIKKNINVLQHAMGYFKKQLSPDEKQELMEVFDHYRNDWVPLIVPVTLINHYVRKYDQPYLKKQTYLNPHPIELRLRTHV